MHPSLLFCGAPLVPQLRSVYLRRRSRPSQGRFRGLLDKCGRGRATCSLRSVDANPASSAKPPRSFATLWASAWPPPIGRRCKASLLGLSADMPGTRRGVPVLAKAREGRHPHRIVGDKPMSPGILWGCRACGASRATAPGRLSGQGVAHKIQLIERSEYDGAAREQ